MSKSIPSMFTSEMTLSKKSMPESELPVIPLVQIPRAAPPEIVEESTMHGSLQPANRITSDPVTLVALDPKLTRFTPSTNTFEQFVKIIPLRPVVFCPSIVPPEILIKPKGALVVPDA